MSNNDFPGDVPSVVDSPTPNSRRLSVFSRLRLRGKSLLERDHSFVDSDYGSVAHGEILGLNIGIRIPYTQTIADNEGKMRISYVIRCTLSPPQGAADNTPVKVWEISKRFSDFENLDKNIKKQLLKTYARNIEEQGGFGLATLPNRHFMTSAFEEQVISERKEMFLKYLQSAMTASFFFETIQPELAKFLECPGVARLPKVNSFESNIQELNTHAEGTAHVTETMQGEAQHGFLYKHGGPTQFLKPFRLVFCVSNVSEGVFRYYRPSHPVLLGEMKVKGVYGKVTLLEPKQYGIPTNGYGFSVWTPSREMILYAESSEDRLTWIKLLKSLLTDQVPENATPTPLTNALHLYRSISQKNPTEKHDQENRDRSPSLQPNTVDALARARRSRSRSSIGGEDPQ